MITVASIKNYLTLDKECLNMDELIASLPRGWAATRLVIPLVYLDYHIPGFQLTWVKIEKGILRITAIGKHDEYTDLFERVAQSIARDSAVRCMWCGKRGYRRKREEGWPCLCKEHYLEYINLINE